ncbi:PhzF family phenazine biosynthesis protein [Pseudoalteromonas agarivorans]|uniref:PhzF family phenazine biosynthesis protein n=1 Tax=Pseudoalteromonas agarivorans TaxID=176102 RepID=UPI00311D742C
MQAKAKRSYLTQHSRFWLMLRFIKHTFTESVFYSHKHNLLGSSALIVIYQNGLTSKMMQLIASKSKHPATVFLNLNEITKPRCKIRWFNQTNEIKRCGHGSLAAAKCLTSHFNYCPKVFVSSSDEEFNINIKRQKAHLKLQTLRMYKTNYEKELAALFSLPIKATYSSAIKNGYTILLFDSKENLESLQVDCDSLAKAHNNAVIALCIPRYSSEKAVAHFRYFAPQFGVNEDAATGSAVSVIAPILFKLTGLNKVQLEQKSSNGALLEFVYNHGHVEVS